MSDDVAIVGIGMHPFGRHDGVSGMEQGAVAIRNACADAGIEWSDLQFAFGGSTAAGAAELSKAQQDYAASDVLYLHRLRERLDEMLEREGRTKMAQSCFEFLPTRAGMDLAGFDELDIFHH